MLNPALERHPHARAVLTAAAGEGGNPSHAYLFQGPPGSGKRAAAAAFAAALLAAGADDPELVRRRVLDRVHPDLTWVVPTGAAVMLRSDIDDPVVAAATRTPFESARRVFVIERADSMNDEAANRLLKTLEEPARFVHLILISDRPTRMLATIVSRCQQVRFESPDSDEIAARLQREGIEAERAQACARLSLGDAELAARLAGEAGEAARVAAQGFARALIAGELVAARPAELLAQAQARERALLDAFREQIAAEAELLGERERKRHEREAETAAKRIGRRARTEALDDGLRLVSLWLRDVAVCADGEPRLVRNRDRAALIADDAQRVGAAHARAAVELVEEARTTLALNPSEPLLLDALASRVERALRG